MCAIVYVGVETGKTGEVHVVFVCSVWRCLEYAEIVCFFFVVVGGGFFVIVGLFFLL